MFGKKSNYINGAWVEGEGEINNINPSDTNDLKSTLINQIFGKNCTNYSQVCRVSLLD